MKEKAVVRKRMPRGWLVVLPGNTGMLFDIISISIIILQAAPMDWEQDI